MKVYRFKLTCNGKEAWCEVDPALVETYLHPEFEAFARAISPLGMKDPDMKVKSLGVWEIKT